MKPSSTNWLREIIHTPGFWLLIAILALITVPHYSDALEYPSFLSDLTDKLGLDRYSLERILYLAPIIWAGFLFGTRGAILTSLAALACMLPRAIFISSHPADALFETGAVFVVGNLVAFTFRSLHKERKRRLHLDALNQVSNVVSQSLELEQVLNGSLSSVINVMRVDAALVFLTDEVKGKLSLAACQGVSQDFINGVTELKLGEGYNGSVAASGEPMYVADAANDPDLTTSIVRQEGIRSQLIVPLKSKGKVMGTLCTAMRSPRHFRKDESELLTAIGNQIGIAAENARLYEEERNFAEQLRISEEKYRKLFENAHDAIWLHDLQGNITAANKSFVSLTGYNLNELEKLKVDDLIAEGCIDNTRALEDPPLRGKAPGTLSEVTLIRKDNSRASVQLSTSPVFSNGRVSAFQHIARDITEEKKMKENLRYYLQQVTRAQEEERKRIAREIHDDTIQSLIVLSRQLDNLASSSGNLPREEKQRLEDLWQQTNTIMDGLRRLSQDLRPATLDRLGLLPALEWLTSDVEKLSGIKISLETTGPDRRVSPEEELVLFRIAQEALRNSWRHSGATSARLIVSFYANKIIMSITDNGKGFSLKSPVDDLTKEGKLGLAGMHERARLLGGSLTVQSDPGSGTTITVEAPV